MTRRRIHLIGSLFGKDTMVVFHLLRNEDGTHPHVEIEVVDEYGAAIAVVPLHHLEHAVSLARKENA